MASNFHQFMIQVDKVVDRSTKLLLKLTSVVLFSMGLSDEVFRVVCKVSLSVSSS